MSPEPRLGAAVSTWQACVVAHLGDPEAVLLVDETGCLKQVSSPLG